MLLLLKANHRGLSKLYLQTHKTHKHALLHVKTNPEWDTYSTSYSLCIISHTILISQQACWARQSLNSCLRGVHEEGQEDQLCSSSYGHNRGSRVFLRCWSLRKGKHVNWCVVVQGNTPADWPSTSAAAFKKTAAAALVLIYCLLQLKCNETQKWKWPFLNYSN